MIRNDSPVIYYINGFNIRYRNPSVHKEIEDVFISMFTRVKAAISDHQYLPSPLPYYPRIKDVR